MEPICPEPTRVHMAERNSVPLVDLSAFGTEGHTEWRLESARALYKACHHLGFVPSVGDGAHPSGPVPHRKFDFI